MLLMPKKNKLDYVMRSRGWDIIRDKEKETGKSISIDGLVERGSLARGTIRRFFDEKDADVSGASTAAAQHAADLIGVPLSELLYREYIVKSPYDEQDASPVEQEGSADVEH